MIWIMLWVPFVGKTVQRISDLGASARSKQEAFQRWQSRFLWIVCCLFSHCAKDGGGDVISRNFLPMVGIDLPLTDSSNAISASDAGRIKFGPSSKSRSKRASPELRESCRCRDWLICCSILFCSSEKTANFLLNLDFASPFGFRIPAICNIFWFRHR